VESLVFALLSFEFMGEADDICPLYCVRYSTLLSLFGRRGQVVSEVKETLAALQEVWKGLKFKCFKWFCVGPNLSKLAQTYSEEYSLSSRIDL